MNLEKRLFTKKNEINKLPISFQFTILTEIIDEKEKNELISVKEYYSQEVHLRGFYKPISKIFTFPNHEKI